MRAMLCHDWGGPETLRLGVAPDPVPDADEVLIEVHAAGLNFADTLMIAGQYQVKPERPFAPGYEAAGIVAATGDNVTGLHVGQRVMAPTGSGAFAELVVVDAARVFPIPDAMPFDEAAAFPVAYGTSHVALRHRGNLQRGETLLVHGAAGGVGLTAVEIGVKLGANVIASAGGDEKVAVARSHGAHHGIDYRTEDVRARVKALTDGRGADVVYDPVGGDIFDESLRCINWEGRLLVIGFAAGRIPSAPANYLLVKNCSVVGVFWGAYMDKNPQVVRESMAELLRWYEEGAVRPHVSHHFALNAVPAAMAMLLSRRSTGKVVINVRE